MIMKRFVYFLAASLALFSSCEKMDEGERFEDYEFELGDKYILVEDFTGQKCVNCPDAAEFLKQMNPLFDDHMILVSMHAGGFALGTPLYNQTAQDYMNALNLKNNPAVSIDRVYNSDGAYTAWSDPLIERVKQNAVCSIDAKLTFSSDNKKVSAVSEVSFKEDVSYKVGVQYYVLRDGIIGYQQSHDGVIPQYEHNHVFSGTMYSNIWGEALAGEEDGSYKNGSAYTSLQTPEFDLKDWDASKVSIVAFVFKYTDGNSMGEILQATKVELSHQ